MFIFLINQNHYFSYCSQRAWLLKLLAIELHVGDVNKSTHLETSRSILANVFGQENFENGSDHLMSHLLSPQDVVEHAGAQTVGKSKVLFIA